MARRIVYQTWAPREIAGGVKAIFQHASMLNAAGLAAVVATPGGERPTWFATDAPVIAPEAIAPDDVLVFAENDGEGLARFAGSPQPKLVFCQSPLQVWRGVEPGRSYAAHGVSHLLAVSHTLMRFCSQRFPDLPRHYAPYFVDHEVFRVQQSKALQVACMPRKRPFECMAIRDLLAARHPDCAAVPWRLLQDADEAEVARTLGESAVFLSLARLEGHAMTTMEAMACGCLVAGFVGHAGFNDSATAANGFWVPEDDLVACADALAAALRLAAAQGSDFQWMVRNARETAARHRRDAVQPVVAGVFRQLSGSF